MNMRQMLALAGVIATLTACSGMDIQDNSRPTAPPPRRDAPGAPEKAASGNPPPSAPAPRRCAPGHAVGILVAAGTQVFINGTLARSGDEVCDGDSVTTGDNTHAQVMVGDDRDADFIQLDSNTDPRFKRLPSGCLLVDVIRQGKLLSAQKGYRGCVVFEVHQKLYYQRASTINIVVEPRNSAKPQLAETKIYVLKGELRPLKINTQQLLTLRPEQLESVKLTPVPMHFRITVTPEKAEVLQRPAAEVLDSATWTMRYRLNALPQDTQRLQLPPAK